LQEKEERETMKETIMLPTTTFTTQTKLVDSGAFSPRIAVLNPYIKIKKLGKIFGVLFILFQGIISWVLSLSLVYTVHCLFVAIPKQDLRLFVTKIWLQVHKDDSATIFS